jgi:hypothetical protein
MSELKKEDFIRTCRCDKESAAGLDGWAARDMALLSNHAISLVGDLFMR